MRETTPLHLSAAAGDKGEVQNLIAQGLDVNAPDERGRTPLHYGAINGHVQTVQALLDAGANPGAVDDEGFRAYDLAMAGGHNGTAANIQSATPIEARTLPAHVPGLNPKLKYRDAASFGRTIGEPAVHVEGINVHVFAAARHERAARIVHPYLERAYDELAAIVGHRPNYDLVVYHFPKGHPDAFGGTSNGTLWYDDANLHLDQFEEWRDYGLPHISGYIEEMAHNFVSSTHLQFGWEMVGWSLGAKVSGIVAPNPKFEQSLAATRRGQAETYQRYIDDDFHFTADLPPNQVDRIHAHLLWQAEQQYGPDFWRDFFAEVLKAQPQFIEADNIGDRSENRNARYRLSIACFDRLPGLQFRRMLEDAQISLTTDINVLDPMSPTWERRLR